MAVDEVQAELREDVVSHEERCEVAQMKIRYFWLSSVLLELIVPGKQSVAQPVGREWTRHTAWKIAPNQTFEGRHEGLEFRILESL